MGIEDAGTMSWLLKNMCMTTNDEFDVSNVSAAVGIYEKLRIPRTAMMLKASQDLGESQQHRSNTRTQALEESLIAGELLLNDTLPIMFQGAMHNYKDSVGYELEELYKKPLSEEEEKLREAAIREAYEQMLGFGA